MEKILQLYTYVDGSIGDTPFPNTDNPIEIGEFRYDAKRMGGAPTIAASVNYPSCLDDEWTDNVYAEFNGEKYFLKQTPTSSYDNADTMYKHDITLVSERVILDNVYFYDAVASSEKEMSSIIGYPPASSEWQYFGNIDISKDYTTFSVRQANGFLIGIFDVVFDEAIRIVSGPPIDMRVESATGDIYVYDNYSYLQAVGLNLVFSYIDYDDDKPVSNSTKVVFFGDVREFASRLQASLAKSGVGYDVLVDDSVTSTEEKLISFEDQFFSNVLQEIYNTYEVPYYFVGKTIHIGDHNKLSEDEQLPVFAYGVDDALLSITKNNANYKIVNRATGTGSSDNIPFYYPNNSPKGEIAVGGSIAPLLKIVDGNAFANEVNIDDVVRYGSAKFSQVSFLISHDGNKYVTYNGEAIPVSIVNMKPINKWFTYTFNVSQKGRIYIGGNITVDGNDNRSLTEFLSFAKVRNHEGDKAVSIKDGYIDCGQLSQGSWTLTLGFAFPYLGRTNYTIALSLENDSLDVWYNETQGKETSLKKMGLVLVSGGIAQGATITQTLVKYVNTSKSLMPFKYRETDGKERFYNATNDTYEGVTFNNPFVAGHPKEHIIKVDDIKPSIEGMEYNGQRIDMFEAFAYDDDDNDETYEDEEGNVYFKHPYFFAKLNPLGFNLFDHAIEQQPMVISFTSGDCGACSFEIAVDEDTQKNTVQVDENGNVKRDEDGNVLCGSEALNQSVEDFQDIQQDTTDHSVWIALRKEEETYGILMPKAPTKGEQGNEIGGHRPSTEDTFVILGINLPYEYIEAAEKKLEAEIIKYLKENNDEKFTFSISFSRIYFAENPDILPLLSENSKIKITYNNKEYDLYVSSYSYSMGDNDALPEIRIELDDTLKVSQNALQNAISEVKSSLGNTINEVAQAVAMQKRSYVSKVEDDIAQGVVNFTKGIKFGEGGKVEVMDNNSAKLTIEYLEVTKKASFTSLEIQEKTHVGGQIIISPAAMTCGEVEELDDAYRCYFQTKGEDGGDEIFNQFAINDLAICQTYNAWGSRYYWRKVVGIGEDYIDLSKTLCDEDSDIPMAGDKIVQLGNTEDITRQAAQVLSAYGEDAPSFIMYNGINDFSLADKNITGIAWNPNTLEPQMYSYGSFFFGDRKLNDNFITFQKKEGDTQKTLTINADVTIGANSSGLTNLAEWKEKQAQIDAATQGVTLVQKDIQNIQDQIDGVVENHFYEGVPTNDNFPAIQWTTEEDKANHIGDTYVNIASEEQDPDNAGKAWRWAYTDNEHTGYHWHPIADTDAVKALLEAYKAQAGIDDLQYLKGTFAKSVDVDGVVMSEMVAVKDGDKIKAFLNGSDIGKDSQHGKLLIAAGVSDISDPSTAATKIYEDGRIEVDAPTVNGKVIISDDGFTYYDTSGSDKKLRASMGGTCAGASGVFIAHNASEPNFCTNAAILAIGGNSIPAANFHGDVVVSGILDARSQGVWCNKIESPFANTIEIVLPEDDGLTRAIRIPYGMIEGLRPKTRVLTNTANASSPHVLTNLDHSVFVNISSDTCYIALPNKPQDGQEYYIESRGGNMNIKLTGKSGYSMYSGTTFAANTSVTQTGRALLRFKFYSDANLWVISWLNRDNA